MWRCMCMYIYIYTYVYMYIRIERAREIDREMYVCMYACMYMYVYIYIYIKTSCHILSGPFQAVELLPRPPAPTSPLRPPRLQRHINGVVSKNKNFVCWFWRDKAALLIRPGLIRPGLCSPNDYMMILCYIKVCYITS